MDTSQAARAAGHGLGANGDRPALRRAIPWIVLASALVLAIAGWVGFERNRLAQARGQFQRRAEIVAAALAARTGLYEQLLRDCAARIASSPATTPAQWRAFVAYLALPERYPALQSLERVEDDGRPTRADDPRRLAMRAAQRSGGVAISGKVELPHGASAPDTAFAMYVPVHRFPASGSGAGARAERAELVAAEVRIHDLLRGILDARALEVLDLRIYDGPRVAPDAVLVDTRSDSPASEPLFRQAHPFPMPGRSWTIEFISQPEFDEEFRHERPWALLAAGLAASFIAFLLARALVASLERAHDLSMHDPLTGLFNRRYVDETMEREIERARRAGASIGVIVLDIDHFKRLNDTFGHDAGDHVLARTGELLRHVTRGGDIACRFGGEEFALILPGASLETARERAETIRALFEATPFVFEGNRIAPLTLSAGVCALPPGGGEWSRVLRQADRALYTAKQAGRNRVLAAAAE